MKRSRLKLSKKARQSSQEWYHSKKSPKSVTEHHLPPLDEPSPAISTSSSPPPVHFKPRLHSPKSTSTFESEHKPEYTLPSPSARSLDYSEPIEETAIKNELYVLPSHCHCQLVKKNANKQTSLLSYLSVKSSTKKTALPSSEEVRMQHLSSKGQDSRPTQMYKRTPKTCPFYKRIPGTSFTVDAFQYGTIPDCNGYFLSHFHDDHYGGLKKSFKHPIYCSQVTGSLVQLKLKVDQEYIHSLPLNEPCVIEQVEVTLLEANHCPGSVLILFKLKSGLNYLHTGDFRFSQSMLHYPSLVGLKVHQLYLDTTYCTPQYDFPPQEEVVAFSVEKSLEAVKAHKSVLIVCGSYTIGKEKIFMAIAEVLGTKVCVSKEKAAIIECINSPRLSSMLTTDYNKSFVHVLPMAKLNLRDLSLYFEKWSSRYSFLLAFRPTGWTYSGKVPRLSAIQPQRRNSVSLYGIPYSEHSSFTELRNCVQWLRPLKIIPTVSSSAQKREEMQQTFKQWLSTTTEGPSGRSNKKTLVQTLLTVKR